MAELFNFGNSGVRFGQSSVQLVFVKYLKNSSRYQKFEENKIVQNHT